MKRFLRDNGLTLFFFSILLLALAGQSVAGLAEFNEQQLSSGQDPIRYGQYLVSSDFGVDVAENWQSEFLQFFLYVLATVWLVQRGSSESKEADKIGLESDEDQRVAEFAGPDSPRWARRRGLGLRLYSHSLGLTMGMIFLSAGWPRRSRAGRRTTRSS